MFGQFRTKLMWFPFQFLEILAVYTHYSVRKECRARRVFLCLYLNPKY